MNPLISSDADANLAKSRQASSPVVASIIAEDDVTPAQNRPLFENPFSIEDLLVFDDATLQRMLSEESFDLTAEKLARCLHGASKTLVKRIECNLPAQQRSYFMKEVHRSISRQEIDAARRHVLDSLFWELTYWKTPDLYEELTEGEPLHPGIFAQLEPDLRGKVILDAGAGSGRASFECLQHGAKLVFAVEPSPGLLHILQGKVTDQLLQSRIVPYRGRFDELPLEDKSVDVALSCSAFTSEPEQGGERGLAELKRVTKSGGKIVLIWPRTQDYAWLAKHGFHYIALPMPSEEMKVHFRSLQSALRCARRFYARNENVVGYMLKQRRPEVPYSVLGFNPPCDYCWLTVK